MFASFSRFFVLALLVAPALSASVQDRNALAPTRVYPQGTDENHNGFYPADIATRPIARDIPEARGLLTNGQRLARGLPPRSPRSNTRRRALAARQSPVPGLTQPTGYIQVTSPTNSFPLGFIQRSRNAHGELFKSPSLAAAVSVALRRGSSNSVPFPIESLNGAGASYFPFVGAVVGTSNTGNYNDLSTTSFNYLYLANTVQAPYGPAQAGSNTFAGSSKIESTIWTLNDDNTLTPLWVNTDGTTVVPSILFVRGTDGFALTASKAAFDARFETTSTAIFTFVPGS
ncbi:hypothetical protein OH77DRAFT_1421372 [Trametes cingulata]|nr:hypothetical protein OH77DRAFT_1421372 [Trametes cingulata]